MKLGLPLLAVAVSAQGPTFDQYLAELNDYCKATYGLPAYRTHRDDTRQQWKQKWENKGGFKSDFCEFLIFSIQDFKIEPFNSLKFENLKPLVVPETN